MVGVEVYRDLLFLWTQNVHTLCEFIFSKSYPMRVHFKNLPPYVSAKLGRNNDPIGRLMCVTFIEEVPPRGIELSRGCTYS